MRGGNEDKAGLSLRYGDTVGEDKHLRGHLKLRKTDEQLAAANGAGANDKWEAAQGGFRFDSFLSGGDEVRVQGDFYRSQSDQDVLIPSVPPLVVQDQVQAEGWNLAGKWQQELNDGSTLELSSYLDFTSRDEGSLGQDHLTFDIDFQHDLADIGMHSLIWGLGYRRVDDSFRNSATLAMIPSSDSFNLFSGFIQDEMALTPEVRFTLGSKVEHNEFTGVEVQPNARMAWIPNDRHMVWGAISRAVRTPSRFEDSASLTVAMLPGAPPTPIRLLGNPALKSEELLAYEAGYRYTVQNLSIDLAVFLNEYENLVAQDFSTPPTLMFINGLTGQSHGVEAAIDWRPRNWWRWQLAYTYQDVDLKPTSLVPDTRTLAAGEGSMPRHQLSVRSSTDLSESVQLDVWGRYVGKLATSNSANLLPVPSYTTLDIRLGWQVSKDIEFSVVGQNLLEPSHLEFVQESFLAPTEIQRGVFGQLKISF